MYGRIASLFLATAALLSAGCTEFMEGYNDAKAHRSEPGYSFAERLARVGDAVANDAGRFATGYANASAEYAYRHPAPVYVQPVYMPQYQYQPTPQHGTMTITPQNHIATGKKPRSPEVDQFAQSFSVAGEKQEKVADEATVALLSKLPFNSDIEKAKAAFAQAQSVEEKFHHDFKGSISACDKGGLLGILLTLEPPVVVAVQDGTETVQTEAAGG
jgi:hypothetical protein